MTAYQAPQNTNTPEPVAHAGPVVWSLAIAVLSFSLMQTLLVPALPELSRAFDLDAASGGWILTTYLLAGAVAAPILGALGDRYGHKRLLLISLGFFVVGSIFALVAPSFSTLLAARVLQGASTATFPLALAIVRSDLMPTAQPAAMGWLSGMLGAGAGAALVIGGVVTDFIGWRWLFSIGAIMGLLSMALIMRFVPRSQSKGGGRIDLAGAALLTAGLVTLLLALTQGNAWGWASIGVLSLVAAAVVSFAAFVIVERTATVPLMNLATLAQPGLALTSIITLFLGAVPYLFYVGLPVLMGASGGIGHGLSVTGVGIAMLPSAVLVFFGGRATPWLLTKLSRSLVAAGSLFLMLLGSVGTALMPGSMIAVIVFFGLVGLGNGIGFAVAADLVTVFAPKSEIAAAAGLNGVLRTVGSAIGTPITGVLLLSAQGSGAHLAPEPFQTLYCVAAAVSLAGVILALCIRVPAPQREVSVAGD
ncbi:MFS transporter [Leucobacter chinensis]|uniref:MFS transporter n=1 Tax=Leucobacter chinensis TaxID=2851010 RepID=UPI001C22D958|nr:MFS transporter [Leucobacter chinensis]